MTETSPLAAVSHPPKGADDDEWPWRAKTGRLSAGVDADRGRAERQELPWDGEAVGEIQVRGPWITGAYYLDPDPEKFQDGWLRTGDVAAVSPEGFIQITDRAKDVIKSGGEWISSVDLENALMAHPAVREAAVVAVPDEKWDERPLACVVLREGEAATPLISAATWRTRSPTSGCRSAGRSSPRSPRRASESSTRKCSASSTPRARSRWNSRLTGGCRRQRRCGWARPAAERGEPAVESSQNGFLQLRVIALGDGRHRVVDEPSRTTTKAGQRGRRNRQRRARTQAVGSAYERRLTAKKHPFPQPWPGDAVRALALDELGDTRPSDDLSADRHTLEDHQSLHRGNGNQHGGGDQDETGDGVVPTLSDGRQGPHFRAGVSRILRTVRAAQDRGAAQSGAVTTTRTLPEST